MANTNINRASILNLDSSTAGTVLAKGTTVERPSSSIPDGAFRFNTTLNKLEYYDGSNWYTIDDEAAPGSAPNALNNFDTTLYSGTNSQQFIGGYIKGTADFNGTSSYIDVPSEIYTAITGPFTLSAWINTTSSGSYKIIIGMGGVNGVAAKGLTMWMDSSGLLYASWGNGSAEDYWSVSPTTPLNTGDWFHVAITVDGLTNPVVKGYVNGVAEGSGSSGSDSITFDTSFTIGARDMGGSVAEYWDGAIDQVRIYNSELSATDITNLYNETVSTATTASYPSGKTATATYTMDTSANGLLTTTDLSTVNYPSGAGCIALYEMNNTVNDTSGTYDGTPTDITYESGCFDQAAVFGSSSIIALPSSSPFGDNNTIKAVSAWVKLTTTTSKGIVYTVSSSSNLNDYFTMQVRGDSNLVYIACRNGSTSNSFLTSVSITPDTAWHHYVFQLGSTEREIYIDGVKQSVSDSNSGSATSTSWISYPSYDNTTHSDIGIGRRSSAYYSAMDLDQVRFFTSTLTQSQVTTLARGIATSYSGANNNVTFNGFLNFQPDMIWFKNRTGTNAHAIVDSVRGRASTIFPNFNYVATTSGASNDLVSFNSNGFTVGTVSNAGSINTNGGSIVAWCWKAGGTSVQNNNGTLTSTVNVNQGAGFSIATYTGVGYPNATTAEVGHGLSQAPELVIIKGTGGTGQSSGAGSWVVGTGVLASDNWLGSLYLNTDAGYYTAVNYFWNGSATSSVVKLKNDWFVNGVNNTYVMYSWHSVSGYSKIGTYSGNGNATGPIIYTTDNGTSGGSNGFEPSWLMIKRTDTTGEWNIFDNKRDTSNPRNLTLWAQSGDTESTASQGGIYDVDFLANGFQIKNTYNPFNNSSGTYLYMTFA